MLKFKMSPYNSVQMSIQNLLFDINALILHQCQKLNVEKNLTLCIFSDKCP